jgi:hypothetical protein
MTADAKMPENLTLHLGNMPQSFTLKDVRMRRPGKRTALHSALKQGLTIDTD